MSNRGSPGRRHATRLLLTVSEMHKRGFQGLRIVPSMKEDPFDWHCHLVLSPYMDPAHGSYVRVEMGSSLPYTSADGDHYVWSDRPGSTARELADQLEHGSLSSWLEGARIDDFAYAGWYVKMLGIAEEGYLPYAVSNGEIVSGDDPLPLFAWPDGTVALAQYSLPPAPKPAVNPGDQPWADSRALIHCPDPDGPPDAIARFALSYDGYGRLGLDPKRVLQVVRSVIRQVKKDSSVPGWAGLDLLRGALFYLQREAHATEYTSSVNEREMRAVTREIVLHVARRPLLNDYYGHGESAYEPLSAGYARRKAAPHSPPL